MPNNTPEVGTELGLQCFEGSEKKMEICFVPENGTHISEIPWDGGMRTYRREHWDQVVGLLQGCILLEDVQEHFDVYLISESSLFVYNDRVVILTCGTTTLLKTLSEILGSAERVGLKVSYFQYSRKNFLFPEEQLYPHSSFDQEVQYMSQIFEDGHPHVFGPLTSDHWNVFVADRIDRTHGKETVDKEQTLNVYMYDIDHSVAQLFMKADPVIIPSILDGTSQQNGGDNNSNSNSQKKASDKKGDGEKGPASEYEQAFSACAREASDRSGISALMSDGHVVHDYLFEPCGYSMNGVAKGDGYWTIHITPEAHCSYASFETNYRCGTYEDLIRRVVNVFKPARFTTVEHIDCASEAGSRGAQRPADCASHRLVNRVVNDFCGGAYSIQVCNFVVADGAGEHN
mmetsp:Transcript_37222/g.72628  ORF Transcript_37222/g.72628 Transcript_37222/m.72628 type:complete len:402 (+) Transcript_37222:360-1565(+)|eukprot:CAMPEP_0173397832 /NCGR_PEP_ID=MMETSP1356-20130122/39592_1 /TAXON_ID=77927 ORGANISM="Hemiselmis virescens, Strain PCC157" /NCGR_SAMPLE_ID=MMETSP1356 /ASSEMBLY_ACC=CAM_ASM_000847 /LENGTH=401 /DNA_ID=CAMNT_0014357179 /DNA_START=274 /DNA_END=1479 /DNA_ORIENTATION=-